VHVMRACYWLATQPLTRQRLGVEKCSIEIKDDGLIRRMCVFGTAFCCSCCCCCTSGGASGGGEGGGHSKKVQQVMRIGGAGARHRRTIFLLFISFFSLLLNFHFHRQIRRHVKSERAKKVVHLMLLIILYFTPFAVVGLLVRC